MKKNIKIVAIMTILIVALIVCAGCSQNSEKTNTSNNTNTSNTKKTEKIDVNTYDFLLAAEKQVSAPQDGDIVAILHVKDYGDIKVKLFKDVAPKAVENFVTLSEQGYYNNVTFHRVINDFMIQSGDPTATGRGGESKWGKPFEDEFSYSLVLYRGALCMANAGSNTNGSQFFIEQAKCDDNVVKLLEENNYPQKLIDAYKLYGGSMHLYLKHTVFGQVVDGMDVVDRIAGCETDDNDKPIKNVVIESIDFIK